MRAILNDVPASLLDRRRETGAGKYDEMWEGVLHMNPAPSIDHQDFQFDLSAWLRLHWKRRRKGRAIHHGVNVSADDDWQDNYRIPDLILVEPERRHLNRGSHFHGGPNVAIEIHSPGDEAYDKFDFFAKLKTDEVWIIHRDSKAVEMHVLADGAYERVEPDADGCVRSPATGVEMKASGDGVLEIRLADDHTTLAELPEGD